MPAKTDEAPDIEPIVVLDLIMPNGKRMRDCTGADMKKFGDLLLKRGESLLKQAEQPKTKGTKTWPRRFVPGGPDYAPRK